MSRTRGRVSKTRGRAKKVAAAHAAALGEARALLELVASAREELGAGAAPEPSGREALEPDTLERIAAANAAAAEAAAKLEADLDAVAGQARKAEEELGGQHGSDEVKGISEQLSATHVKFRMLFDSWHGAVEDRDRVLKLVADEAAKADSAESGDDEEGEDDEEDEEKSEDDDEDEEVDDDEEEEEVEEEVEEEEEDDDEEEDEEEGGDDDDGE